MATEGVRGKVMKTATISVDSIIFDIEDGVAVNQKVSAVQKGPYIL